MIITILLLMMLVLIPSNQRKSGVRMVLQGEYKGSMLLVISFLFEAMIYTQLAFIWFSDYLLICMIVVGLYILIRFIHYKKYIFLKTTN